MSNIWKDSFQTKVTREQCKDTGMAIVLILLILTLIMKDNWSLRIAIGIHVLNMIAPQLFRPLAVIWLGLSRLLGTVMSKVILSLVFFGVVTPVGLIRRFLGKDSLKIQAFKKGRESVMFDRNHKFTAVDIERPY